MVAEGKTKYGTHNLVRGEGVVLSPETGTGVDVQNYGAGSLSGLESDDETSVNDQKVIRGRLPWPGGMHSIVLWNGVEWDCLGLPKEYTRGARTKHFMVRIRRRGAEVK
jgi:hypothetical protein